MGPPDAVAYYDGAGTATGDPNLTAIPVDQFGRAQIRDIRLPSGPGTGAVLRQGAWQSDGDPTNVQGEGLVVYGPAPNGLHDSFNGTIGRVKYDRFQIRMIIAGVDIGSAWRVDTVRQWFTDNAGTRTFEIVRSTGNCTTGGNIEPFIDGTGFIGTGKAKFLRVYAYNVNPNGGNFSVATLPPFGLEGDISYATDGRKVGEGPGMGTGVPVYFSNGAWLTFSGDTVVLA